MHETEVPIKAPKLLWNVLPKLNKKIMWKILSQRRKLLHTLQNASKIFLLWREITYGTCQCRFWTFQTEIFFLIFLSKKMQRPSHQKIKLRLDIRFSLKGTTITNLVLIVILQKIVTHCPGLRMELCKTAFEH